MSLERDSSSSAPRGQGGGAYPPGADPYGARSQNAATDATDGWPEAAAAEPEAPQTETTLTTRVRISIPGSRPIPPVVVRTPVSEAADKEAPRGPVRGEGEAAVQEVAPAEPVAGGAVAAAGSSGPAEAGGGGKKISDWFEPRRPMTAMNQPSASGSPTDPSGSAPAAPEGMFVPGPRSADSGGHPGTPYLGEPPWGAVTDPGVRPDGTPPYGLPAFDGTQEFDSSAVQAAVPASTGPTSPAGPAGPTTGPVTGDLSVLPPGFSLSGPPGPGFPGDTSGEGPAASTPTSGIPGLAGASYGAGPSATVGGPSPFDAVDGGGDPGLDETHYGGIHMVDPEGTDASLPVTRPVDPQASGSDFAYDAGPPAKKGRSKLVLLGVLVAAVIGIAYGAGLLLDHTDVPKGTTVLGVGIGSSTEEDAVSKLESALGERMAERLTIEVDGRQRSLKPSVAGLSFDADATVSSAAGRDYNPVTVIGSLIGQPREAAPVLVYDEEKLRAALEEMAGPGSGSAGEGTVKFVNGRAVAALGKTYRAVDIRKSVVAVEAAYRERAATGRNVAITLPMSIHKPKAGRAEIDRALKEFGEPAMSGWVWLRAGDVEVPFSEQTLSELLTMKPSANGRLQPVIDTEALQEKYGGAFDDVVIDAGTGVVKMTPKHAAAAMIQALRKPAPAEPEKRVALVEGARSK